MPALNANIRAEPLKLHNLYFVVGDGQDLRVENKKPRATPRFLFGETDQMLTCQVGRRRNTNSSAGWASFSIVLSLLKSSYLGLISHSSLMGSELEASAHIEEAK